MAQTDKANILPLRARRGLLLWGALLFGLTTLGVVWLRTSGVNPADGFSPAIILIAYSPSLAALVTAGVLGKWKAVRRLVRPIGRWRVKARYYAFAILLPFIILGLAHFLWRLGGGEAGVAWLDVAGLAPGLGAIIAGSLGEEIGWRGFAQPLLQRKLTIFWASVVVGLLWATWHCWPLFAPGGHEQGWLLDVGLTYLRLVSTAVLYGWLFNVSGGSLLLVMLAHAAHNVAVTSMPVPEMAHGLGALVAVLYFIAAVALGIVARRQLFTHSAKL